MELVNSNKIYIRGYNPQWKSVYDNISLYVYNVVQCYDRKVEACECI